MYRLKVYYFCFGCREIFIEAGERLDVELQAIVMSKTGACCKEMDSKQNRGTLTLGTTHPDHADYSIKMDYSNANQHHQPSIDLYTYC